jgi:glyoxylase I family protein
MQERVGMLLMLASADAYAVTGFAATTHARRAMTPVHASANTAAASNMELQTEIQFGGIPSVGVLVPCASEALRFYTSILGMVAVTDSEPMDNPGACVRIGAQTIRLMESSTPDPFDVDPTYNMSAPPPGYVCKGRPVHAGRDRHVAITLHDLAPLKASLESNGVPYTMSYSGRQALFCRDEYGNGWEFGPPVTYENATRLFPPYLAPQGPVTGQMIGWGGIPHVGLLGSDTERAKQFYCGVLGMVDENDLRPEKLPFPGLFLRCGEQQVHYLELPNPDPDAVDARPQLGRDRYTAYSVKSLAPVRAALAKAGIEYRCEDHGIGSSILYCRDPDANALMLVEDAAIQPIAEAFDGPSVPWTRLW